MLDLLISGGLPTTVPTPADTTKVVSFFEKLGIYPKSRNGYNY